MVGLEKPKVIIAGMGPGGLTAAIEAIKKGYDVLILDSRSHATRSQRLKMDKPTYAYLKTLMNPNDKADVDFIERIKVERSVRIDHLQNYLHKKLDPTGKLLQQGKILIGQEHEIVRFDLTQNRNKVVIKSNGVEKEIPFDYFVAADGAKRTMAKKLNEALEQAVTLSESNIRDLRAARDKIIAEQPEEQDAPGVDPQKLIKQKALNKINSELKTLEDNLKKLKTKIQTRPLEIQTRQAPHGTVSLRVKPPTVSSMQTKKLIDRDLTIKDLSQLKALGWEEPDPPKCYIFWDKEQAHFYVAGEIPQKILELKDPEQTRQMTEWGKLILKLKLDEADAKDTFELDVNPGNTPEIIKENRLRATAFEVRLQYIDTPSMRLNNNSFFVSIGDAFLNANFNLGRGACDAILDARVFSENLKADPMAQRIGRGFSSEMFNEYQRLRKEHIKKSMSHFEGEDMKFYKENMETMRKEIIRYGEHLVILAKTLGESSPSLTKERQGFEALLTLVKNSPESFYTNPTAAGLQSDLKTEKDKRPTPPAKPNLTDALYEKILDFSEAIRKGIDAQLQLEKTKTHAINSKLDAINVKRTTLLTAIQGATNAVIPDLIEREKQWKAEREALDSMQRDLGKALEMQEQVEKKLTSMQAAAKQVGAGTTSLTVIETPALLVGYAKKLTEKIKSSSPPPSPKNRPNS